MKITNKKKNVSKTFGMRQSGLDSLDYLRCCNDDISASELVNQALELMSKKEKMKEAIKERYKKYGEVNLMIHDRAYYHIKKETIMIHGDLYENIILTISDWKLGMSIEVPENKFIVHNFGSDQLERTMSHIPLENCKVIDNEHK